MVRVLRLAPTVLVVAVACKRGIADMSAVTPPLSLSPVVHVPAPYILFAGVPIKIVAAPFVLLRLNVLLQ